MLQISSVEKFRGEQKRGGHPCQASAQVPRVRPKDKDTEWDEWEPGLLMQKSSLTPRPSPCISVEAILVEITSQYKSPVVCKVGMYPDPRISPPALQAQFVTES